MTKKSADIIKLYTVDPRIAQLGARILDQIYEHHETHGPLSVVSVLGILETLKIVLVNEEWDI